MLSLTRLLYGAIFLLGAAGCGAQPASGPQSPKGRFSLLISAKQSAQKPGEPMPMQLTFTNVSNAEITTDWRSQVNFELVVRNSKGTVQLPSDESKKPLRDGEIVIERRGGPVRFLSPGEAVTIDFEMDKRFRYTLTEADKYTVQAQRYDDRDKVTVKSNIVSVTITK
jgi:hypothetical protein